MANTFSNNKRIAKNSLLLNFRLLLTMFVTFFSSRIILQNLGVVDFGIYNVVGGLVSILGFLSGTLSTSSSRFITVAIGKNDVYYQKKTFANVFSVNVFLAIIVTILAETVGLYFFHNQLKIPLNRLEIAFWVFQFSICCMFLHVVMVPFNALIIAHEKMDFFAYVSIYDVLMKLLVAYGISLFPIDKLWLYSILVMIVVFSDVLIYIIYCLKNFDETSLKIETDKKLQKQLFSFLGWSSYGSFVSIGFTQGLNVLLNLFFGPAVNAARGIATQVLNAILGFSINFQTAINPQITKNFVKGDLEYVRSLVLTSSRFSMLLLAVMSLPFIFETDFILSFWLGQVPENTVMFVRMSLIICIFSSLANPLRIVNQAEGNIKQFQLFECSILLLIVPVSYVLLRVKTVAYIVYIVHLFMELIAHCVRIKIVFPKMNMNLKTYLWEVYGKFFFFIIMLCPLLFISHKFIDIDWLRFVLISFFDVTISIFILYFFILNASERSLMIEMLQKIKGRILK